MWRNDAMPGYTFSMATVITAGGEAPHMGSLYFTYKDGVGYIPSGHLSTRVDCGLPGYYKYKWAQRLAVRRSDFTE